MEENDNQWLQCNACKEMLYRREVERNLKVCPKCNYHFRISAAERLAMVVDDGTFLEFDKDLEPLDPLTLPVGECTSCLLVNCDRYKIIYTRRKH